jgi:hypothetical protein
MFSTKFEKPVGAGLTEVQTEVTPSNSRVSPRDCISLRTLRIIMYDRIQLMYDVR